MRKHLILFLLVCMAFLLVPVQTDAKDKHVTDCLENNEDCLEELEKPAESSDTGEEELLKDNNFSSGSLALNIVKMVFALLLILALIYLLLWFLKKRNAYQQVGSLENVGGISLGQNKSVQIVRIGSKMYVLGVGDNVDLLKELSAEDAEKVMSDRRTDTVQTPAFLQNILQKKTTNKQNENHNTDDFTASLQKELDKLKSNRQQIMEQYDKKDGGHV